jgi:hypothetical protein
MLYRILTERGYWIYGHRLTDCLEEVQRYHVRIVDVQELVNGKWETTR